MVDKKKTKKGRAGAKASRPPVKKKPRATAKPAKAAREATRVPEKAAAERRPKAPKAARPPQPKPQVAASGPAPLGIHDLRPAFGATHSKKRVGRGPGSGHGKTAGRGSKGQKSRSGYHHLRGFEGGQNLSALDRFESGTKVTPDVLASHRLARRSRLVKILGDGQIGKPLEVSAHKFSAGAQSKIEAAGGRCEVIPR